MKKVPYILSFTAMIFIGTSSIDATERKSSASEYNQVNDAISNSVAEFNELAVLPAPICYSIYTQSFCRHTKSVKNLSKVRSEKEVNPGYLELRKLA